MPKQGVCPYSLATIRMSKLCPFFLFLAPNPSKMDTGLFSQCMCCVIPPLSVCTGGYRIRFQYIGYLNEQHLICRVHFGLDVQLEYCHKCVLDTLSFSTLCHTTVTYKRSHHGSLSPHIPQQLPITFYPRSHGLTQCHTSNQPHSAYTSGDRCLPQYIYPVTP